MVYWRAVNKRSVCMKAILFDKDGTLLDFSAFWLPIAHQVMDALGQHYPPLAGELRLTALKNIGVEGNDVAVTGCLCGGTYEDIGAMLYDTLKETMPGLDRDAVIRETEEAFMACADAGKLTLSHPRLPDVLETLKAQGTRLFVVTADCLSMTRLCLEKLGIVSFFEELLTTDGENPPKPDPYYINYLCEKYGFAKEDMCMVGDSLVDMRFARNGGIKALGVGKSAKNREILSPLAAATAETIVELFDRHEF